MSITSTVVVKDDQFESIVGAALAQRGRAQRIAREVVATGLKNVYLVGCGGSLNAFGSTHYLLERRSARFPVFHMNSDEFVIRRPAHLGAGSLVLIASHNGTTKETLEAARVAREAGARVVAFTKDESTPLAPLGDDVFVYDSDRTIIAPKQVLILQLGYALLQEAGVPGDYEGIQRAFDALPRALDVAHDEADEFFPGIADAMAASAHRYVLAGGPNYAVGYGMAMCYFLEMQRLGATAFHANEFFHGAFEIVDRDTPILMWRGEDASSSQIDRLEAFLSRYNANTHVIDSRRFALEGVPAELRGEVTPLLLSSLSKRLAEHLEAATGNPLTHRRYMFTVEY
ncbi:SIS domain-containing protein [Streptomyces mirabilis]|uniref:SIS domain-containing protein n=1 Tax=Streptomyces mirabilis TaxID=68239 RepID=UPI000765E187|nr:SIS domain-containing protein [Streptomyces mirabilis]MCX4428588.1 SIS domain-containing protein [Streptomyces mirabilis]